MYSYIYNFHTIYNTLYIQYTIYNSIQYTYNIQYIYSTIPSFHPSLMPKVILWTSTNAILCRCFHVNLTMPLWFWGRFNVLGRKWSGHIVLPHPIHHFIILFIPLRLVFTDFFSLCLNWYRSINFHVLLKNWETIFTNLHSKYPWERGIKMHWNEGDN